MQSDMRRLRLAMVSYGLPLHGRKRGGIERAAHTLADVLARRGHEVVVFTHDPRPDEATYEVRDLPWKRFVETWLGRRVTMGYLGNLLAILPDYGEFDAIIDTVLATATLDRPTSAPLAAVAGKTGRDGVHTEAMGYILAELQSVARAHPDATW